MCKNKLFWHFPLNLQGQWNLKYINLNVNFTNKLYIILKKMQFLFVSLDKTIYLTYKAKTKQ